MNIFIFEQLGSIKDTWIGILKWIDAYDSQTIKVVNSYVYLLICLNEIAYVIIL